MYSSGALSSFIVPQPPPPCAKLLWKNNVSYQVLSYLFLDLFSLWYFMFSKSFFFFFLNCSSIYLFTYLFIFSCVGSSLLCEGFLRLRRAGATLHRGRGPLTVAASLAVEHRLQTRTPSSCGSRAQSLRGTRDLPRPGLEPVSPALAGRFSTTAPPGKPW